MNKSWEWILNFYPYQYFFLHVIDNEWRIIRISQIFLSELFIPLMTTILNWIFLAKFTLNHSKRTGLSYLTLLRKQDIIQTLDSDESWFLHTPVFSDFNTFLDIQSSLRVISHDITQWLMLLQDTDEE